MQRAVAPLVKEVRELRQRIDPPKEWLTVPEAARVLLTRWLDGAFEDGADAVADDAITAQWAHVDRTYPDATPVIEAWLRALASDPAAIAAAVERAAGKVGE